MTVPDTTRRILRQRAQIVLDTARYLLSDARLGTLDEVELRHMGELAGAINQETQLIHRDVMVALRALTPEPQVAGANEVPR